MTFFETPIDEAAVGEWFTPTDHSRGPWDGDSCHAGPPTGLLVRSMERALPDVRLARITVELAKPIPMAGFHIAAEVTRRGRTVATTRATVVDGEGEVRATATGLHAAIQQPPLFDGPLDNSGVPTPRLADARAGALSRSTLGATTGSLGSAARRCACATRPVSAHGPGSSTVWMNTAPLIPGETPSPFQAICPLADCGNAFSRHAEPWQVQFANVDLTIALHRDPVGEWFGSRTVSWWQPGGVGLADAVLFDDEGPVGRALQTIVLRSAQVPD